MEVFAFPTVRTATSRKKETGVFDSSSVGASEACIAFDVATRLGLGFTAGSVLGQDPSMKDNEITLSSCPRGRPLPICCTICLTRGQRMVG